MYKVAIPNQAVEIRCTVQTKNTMISFSTNLRNTFSLITTIDTPSWTVHSTLRR